jgi:hypothetical protein
MGGGMKEGAPLSRSRGAVTLRSDILEPPSPSPRVARNAGVEETGRGEVGQDDAFRGTAGGGNRRDPPMVTRQHALAGRHPFGCCAARLADGVQDWAIPDLDVCQGERRVGHLGSSTSRVERTAIQTQETKVYSWPKSDEGQMSPN